MAVNKQWKRYDHLRGKVPNVPPKNTKSPIFLVVKELKASSGQTDEIPRILCLMLVSVSDR